MADQAEWFEAFVERVLVEVFEPEEVIQDDDGDFMFGDETATAYVSVDPEPQLGVCVWSIAAHQVKGSASVLRELNDLNIGARLAKVIWFGGQVRVVLRLPADQVSVESLARACGHVQGITSDIGQLFSAVHGGDSVLAEPQAS